VERSSERIAHSEEYLRIVIEATEGLVLRSIEVTNIRNEARKPIQGHLCVVSKNVRMLV
jgi:predicted TPR repeat methyltransferase